MNRALSISLLASSLLACNTPAATVDAASGNDAASGVDAASGNDAASTTDSGGGGSDCMAYCTASLANCATMEPQYSDMASCLGTCAAFTPGVAGDTSGNTLACRLYHTMAAASMPGMEHCLHGGPAGYDTCGTSQCAAFCQIAAHSCTGANQVWATNDACMTDCAMMAGSTPDMPAGAPDYSATETSGDSFACRMYHLTVASSSALLASAHCSHIALVSSQCHM
jgi:hypothetical protein